MGKPISAEALQYLLTQVNQCQRHSAAMELAFNEKDAPLVNTRLRIVN